MSNKSNNPGTPKTVGKVPVGDLKKKVLKKRQGYAPYGSKDILGNIKDVAPAENSSALKVASGASARDIKIEAKQPVNVDSAEVTKVVKNKAKKVTKADKPRRKYVANKSKEPMSIADLHKHNATDPFKYIYKRIISKDDESRKTTFVLSKKIDQMCFDLLTYYYKTESRKPAIKEILSNAIVILHKDMTNNGYESLSDSELELIQSDLSVQIAFPCPDIIDILMNDIMIENLKLRNKESKRDIISRAIMLLHKNLKLG